MTDLVSIEGKPTSVEVRGRLAGQRVLLAFSRGKDSLAAWLALRAAGVEVVPYHMHLIPGLEFEAESLAYYEEWFGQRIIRLPHPSLYRWLRNLTFQPPERCAVIEAARFPNVTYDRMANWLREDQQMPRAWVADGVRAADSPVRRLAFATHGPMKERSRKVSVVWDWRKSLVMQTIEDAGVKLPPDYEWFGRSFDGVDARFLIPLRDNAPRDYARVLEWLPLAELEVFRAEAAA